jgi:RiboL-PSP-HEPN
LTLSLELTRKADYQKYASSVRTEDIIAKLHACFTTPNQYQLNVQAFAQHNANFRQGVVNDTFTQCGIMRVAQYLRQAEPFISFLRDEDPERDLEIYLAKNDDVVFSRLNDLANRRNDVAHGSPVTDILSRDILCTYVNFIEAYADGLALIAYEQTLPSMLKRAVPLGRPISVIDNRIVCIEFPTGQIRVGDTLIAKTQDTSRPFKGGCIKEIQQDHVSLETVNGGPDVKIGLLVEFGAKQNQEFYYFKAT